MADKLDFLIIGAGRGGTSLITSCLDAHPDVVAEGELYTVEYLRGLNIPEDSGRYDLTLRVESFFESCNQAAKKCNKSLFGNKVLAENIYWLQECLTTTQQDLTLHIQPFFDQIQDGLKIIFMVRDGRNLIASKVRRTQQLYSLALFRYEYFMFIFRYLKKNYNPLLVLKFEDLVQHPEQELVRVCKFLDIDFVPAMIATDGRSMPENYKKSFFDTTKTEIESIPDDLMRLIKDNLVYSGY